MDEIANPFAAISTATIADTSTGGTVSGSSSASGDSAAGGVASSPTGAVAATHSVDCEDNDLTYTAQSIENVSSIFSFLAVNIGAKCNSLKASETAKEGDGEPI